DPAQLTLSAQKWTISQPNFLGLGGGSSSAPPAIPRPSAPATVFQRPLPIDHVVVLIRENRTYDSYFGTFPGGDGIPTGVKLPKAPDLINPDPPHTHQAALSALGKDA